MKKTLLSFASILLVAALVSFVPASKHNYADLSVNLEKSRVDWVGSKKSDFHTGMVPLKSGSLSAVLRYYPMLLLLLSVSTKENSILMVLLICPIKLQKRYPSMKGKSLFRLLRISRKLPPRCSVNTAQNTSGEVLS